MSYYSHILDELCGKIKEKGFTEDQLGAAESPGWLEKQLAMGLSEAIDDSFIFNSKEEFRFSITGFFNNNRNMLHFTFQYEFDPNIATDLFKKLSVATGDQEHSWDDLPSLKQVCQQFSVPENKVVALSKPISRKNKGRHI